MPIRWLRPSTGTSDGRSTGRPNGRQACPSHPGDGATRGCGLGDPSGALDRRARPCGNGAQEHARGDQGTTTDRILAIVPPVAAFVAAGFEHSIANMYFMPVGVLI
ncbi:MAG: formate/nitrite transporter family protein, partial [Aeromicrobium sp.]